MIGSFPLLPILFSFVGLPFLAVAVVLFYYYCIMPVYVMLYLRIIGDGGRW
jgi:hypothetical protein